MGDGAAGSASPAVHPLQPTSGSHSSNPVQVPSSFATWQARRVPAVSSLQPHVPLGGRQKASSPTSVQPYPIAQPTPPPHRSRQKLDPPTWTHGRPKQFASFWHGSQATGTAAAHWNGLMGTSPSSHATAPHAALPLPGGTRTRNHGRSLLARLATRSVARQHRAQSFHFVPSGSRDDEFGVRPTTQPITPCSEQRSLRLPVRVAPRPLRRDEVVRPQDEAAPDRRSQEALSARTRDGRASPAALSNGTRPKEETPIAYDPSGIFARILRGEIPAGSSPGPAKPRCRRRSHRRAPSGSPAARWSARMRTTTTAGAGRSTTSSSRRQASDPSRGRLREWRLGAPGRACAPAAQPVHYESGIDGRNRKKWKRRV